MCMCVPLHVVDQWHTIPYSRKFLHISYAQVSENYENLNMRKFIALVAFDLHGMNCRRVKRSLCCTYGYFAMALEQSDLVPVWSKGTGICPHRSALPWPRFDQSTACMHADRRMGVANNTVYEVASQALTKLKTNGYWAIYTKICTNENFLLYGRL